MMAELYYDNSKDLYEGLIIEIDDGVQYQVAQVFPSFRDEYGKLFAAAPDMREALKDLRHHFQVAGELLNLSDSHIASILAPTDKALAKGGKQ